MQLPLFIFSLRPQDIGYTFWVVTANANRLSLPIYRALEIQWPEQRDFRKWCRTSW